VIDALVIARRTRAPIITAVDAGLLSLDDLAADTFVPDFVKIDIEGGELDALRGARAILRDLGYRVDVVDQRRFLRDHRPMPHNRWIVAERQR